MLSLASGVSESVISAKACLDSPRLKLSLFPENHVLPDELTRRESDNACLALLCRSISEETHELFQENPGLMLSEEKLISHSSCFPVSLQIIKHFSAGLEREDEMKRSTSSNTPNKSSDGPECNFLCISIIYTIILLTYHSVIWYTRIVLNTTAQKDHFLSQHFGLFFSLKK